MKHTLAIAITTIFLAQASPAALAQVAKRPLLPEGNLFLDIGNFSPLETDIRAYGGVDVASGNVKFKDGFEWDTDETSLAGAVDVSADSIIVSGGLSLESRTQSGTSGGILYESETDSSQLVGIVGSEIGEGLFLSAQLERIVIENTQTASLGSVSLSSSVEVEYFDLTVGSSFDLNETISIGGSLSPAVSDKKEYSGVLSGIEYRAGHGQILILGVGARIQSFAVGFDVAQFGEELDAEAPKGSAYFLSGEILIADEISLGGYYSSSSFDPLKENNQFVSSAIDGSFLGVEGRKQFNNIVISIGYQKSSFEGKDTGDTVFDADRFDTADDSTLSLSIVADI